MPLMLSKAYEALRVAGTPEDKARAGEQITVCEKIDCHRCVIKWMIAGICVGVRQTVSADL